MSHALEQHYYLMRALELAKRGLGCCAPNPSVGALIVKRQKIIGAGYHHGVGSPHAEVEAIRACRESPKGGTIYISLEPCCHYGKTPPCTQAIIQAHIQQVVYAHADCHTQAVSQSTQLLEQSGIEVCHRVVKDIEDFYQPYDYWHQKGLPWVSAKLAVSLDAGIAHSDKSPANITGSGGFEFTHQKRYQHDAILTTVKTIKADNPRLNVRLNQPSLAKPIYVLDTHLSFPFQARLLQSAQSITLFHSPKCASNRKSALEALGFRCVSVPEFQDLLDWQAMLSVIAQEGRQSCWVEAGALAYQSLLQSGLCQRAYLCLGHCYLQAPPIDLEFLPKEPESFWLGDDLVLQWSL